MWSRVNLQMKKSTGDAPRLRNLLLLLLLLLASFKRTAITRKRNLPADRRPEAERLQRERATCNSYTRRYIGPFDSPRFQQVTACEAKSRVSGFRQATSRGTERYRVIEYFLVSATASTAHRPVPCPFLPATFAIDLTPDMELGHWVTGSMGHLGHLSRPGHRVIILTRRKTRVFSGFRKKPKLKI